MRHPIAFITAAMAALLSVNSSLAQTLLYGNVPDEAMLVSMQTDGSRLLTEIFTDDDYLIANGGGVYADGKYYVIYLDDYNPYITYSCLTTYVFDGTTMQRQSSKMMYDEDMYVATDMTYDPAGKKIYGTFRYYEESATFLATLDPSTGRLTKISTQAPWVAMAAAANGTLYAVDRQGNLNVVDKNNGAATLVGSTGLTPATPCSATIDRATGKCYMTMSDGSADAALYELNLATGQASTVMVMPGDQSVTGIFSLSQAAPKAPSPVTDLTARFEQEALAGSISFHAPLTTTDGEEASGSLTYTVTANGTIVAMGQTAYGAQVDAAVSLSEAGEYTFAVTVADGTTISEPNEITLWVGPDNRATLTPEFLQTFSSAADLEPFTIIDANNDKKVWNYYNNRVRISYNSYKAMDDWLISPRIVLESGKQYIFTINISTSTSCPERFEVKLGDAPTAEAMTATLVEPTVLQSEKYNEPTQYKVRFTVPEDGKYFVGIHGISDEDEDTIYLHSFGISAGTAIETPDAPAISLTGAPDFGLSVIATVTAPTAGINGATIDELEKIELLRDGTLIHTELNPAPGSTFTVTDDTDLCAGYHTYTATAYAAGAAGDTAEEKIYVGVAVMEAPAEADFVQTEPGQVTVTWSAPQHDVLGRDVAPGLYTYRLRAVVDGYEKTIAEGIDATEYSYTVCAPTEAQNFYYFAVTAVTDAGESDPVLTDHKPVGAFYTLPYADSFANGETPYVYGVKRLAGATAAWSIRTTDMEAADKDGGFVAMTGSYPGEQSRLCSGYIDMANAAKPVLRFSYYDLDNVCENTLEVLADCGDGFKHLDTIVTNGIQGWNHTEINLAPADFIRLAFVGTIVTHSAISIDCLEIADKPESVCQTPIDGSMHLDGNILTLMSDARTECLIATPDGCTVYTGQIVGTHTETLDAGIYIVRFGTHSVRILVR